jgi:hypothetical protein
MLIRGEWALEPDGVIRPIIRGELSTATGEWLPVTFLVDPGADRTVIHAGFVDALGFDSSDTGDRLSGAGGRFESVRVPTRLQLTRSDGVPVPINGPFSVSTDPTSPDCSLLGRDVLNLFAVIIDRPADMVCLLSGRHRYVIQES